MISDWRSRACAKSLICLVILQVGCSTVPPRLQEATFSVTGKLSVRDTEGNHSARFRWAQAGEHYEIDVWGVLGQGRVRLSGEQNFMAISRGDETLAQGTPEDVMYGQLGWSLPVEVLRMWLMGNPHHRFDVANLSMGPEGYFTAFSQAGWQVELSRHGAFADPSIPKRIVAENEAYRIVVALSEVE